MTETVHWINQAGDFHTKYTTMVEIVLTELDAE